MISRHHSLGNKGKRSTTLEILKQTLNYLVRRSLSNAQLLESARQKAVTLSSTEASTMPYNVAKEAALRDALPPIAGLMAGT